MTGDQQFMYALFMLGLAGIGIWIYYEIMKGAIKNALRELKAEDKAKAEKEAQEMTKTKIQD